MNDTFGYSSLRRWFGKLLRAVPNHPAFLLLPAFYDEAFNNSSAFFRVDGRIVILP